MVSNKGGSSFSVDDSDLSSAVDNNGDASPPHDSNDYLASTDTKDDGATLDNNITTLCPNKGRPNFRLDDIKNSAIGSMLPEFLAQMHAANQELEEEKSAGTIANRRIELDVDDSDVEDKQYIEMNLGLGVLEEKDDVTSTTSENDSSSEGSSLGVMERLLGRKRKRSLEGSDEETSKKARIQEV